MRAMLRLPMINAAGAITSVNINPDAIAYFHDTGMDTAGKPQCAIFFGHRAVLVAVSAADVEASIVEVERGVADEPAAANPQDAAHDAWLRRNI